MQRQRPAPAPGEALTPGRRRLFWAMTLLIPFVLLLVLEGSLRLFGYGDDLPLVVRKRSFGREWHALNAGVGKRYFSQGGIAVPELYDDTFALEKGPRTKRIFLLGESTMAGYPFDYGATPSRLLRDRLQALVPQFEFEVVNAALAAVNSYTVLDFADELAGYEPDAFVIYVGHNEFYGALGVASSESFGGGRALTKLALSLRTVKVAGLLKGLIAGVRGAAGGEPERRDGTLMEVMARGQSIPYGSEEYLRARGIFEANLREIIGIARERGIPVIVSTLASNVRDQEPLQPVFSPLLDDAARERWASFVREGTSAFDAGRYADAARAFGKAVAADSLQADSRFRLARCLDALGDRSAALVEYEKARDFDGLRFRASGEFSDVIRRVCRELETPVADAERAFADSSPDGIVGGNLMMEHLHPNFDGYFLLAKTFFEALVQNGVVPSPPLPDPGDDVMKRRAGITPFDLETANARIRELTSRWPFRERPKALRGETADSALRSVVARYLRKQIIWSQAHFELARTALAAARYDEAVAEYRAVANVAPLSYYAWMMIGDAYRLASRPDSAEANYRTALTCEDSPFVHVRLGMLYFAQERTDRAIEEFESTLRSEAGDGTALSTKEISTVRYFLGASHGKQGALEEARRNLRLAVEIDPSNQDARMMLAQIP